MIKRTSVLLLAIAFSSLLSISAGGVEIIEHCNALSFNSSNQEGNYTIPLFDPNLGNLVGVNLAVDFAALQDFKIENEEPESQNVSVDSEVVLSITMPDSSSISVNTSSSISEELAGYDGEMDYKGQSGKTIEGVESKGSAKEKYTKLSDFIASSQNETVLLPAVLSFTRSTSGSIAARLSIAAESKICVTYNYEPKAL